MIINIASNNFSLDICSESLFGAYVSFKHSFVLKYLTRGKSSNHSFSTDARRDAHQTSIDLDKWMYHSGTIFIHIYISGMGSTTKYIVSHRMFMRPATNINKSINFSKSDAVQIHLLNSVHRRRMRTLLDGMYSINLCSFCG